MANGVADWPRIETMKSLARRSFLILEKAWKRLNVTLVDFKANHHHRPLCEYNVFTALVPCIRLNSVCPKQET